MVERPRYSWWQADEVQPLAVPRRTSASRTILGGQQ
jgi:hypothetical protein